MPRSGRCFYCKDFFCRFNFDVDQINETLVELKLPLGPVSRKDNGTYRCIAFGTQGEVSKDVHLLVLGTAFYYCTHSCFILWRFHVQSLPGIQLSWAKFLMIYLDSPGRCILNWAMTSSIHIPFNSLFTDNPTLDTVYSELLTMSVNKP